MTIGGGKILDSAPPKHKRLDSQILQGLKRLEGDIAETIEQVIMDSGAAPLSSSEVRIKIGEPEDIVDKTVGQMCDAGKIIRISGRKDTRYLHKSSYTELEKKLMTLIKGYLDKNPHRTFIPYEELRSRLLRLTDNQTFKTVFEGLLAKRIIHQKNSDVSLVGYEVKLKPQDQELIQKIEDTFKRTGFSSPLPEEVRLKLGLTPKIFMNSVHSLFEKGALVRLSERIIYHRESFEQAKRIVMEHLKKNQTITVAELRDKLQLSRKYATAILEYFDGIGLTKREKDVHILR